MLRVCVLAISAGLAAPAFGAGGSGASVDGNVEWAGLSHAAWRDRAPRVPLDGEAFTVRFQAFRGDLAGAAIEWDDGVSAGSAGASVVASRGPYDIWEATVPATASATLAYRIAASDGADTDYLGASGVTDAPTAAPFALDFATLDHAPHGATPVDGGTVFRVWAPSRATCDVRGSFNGWTTGDRLTRVGQDFIGFVPGAGPGDMYKYFFNGGLWKPDARAVELVPSDNYNTRIVDAGAFPWQHPGFSPVPREEMVVYQLHVGSFAGRNDPAGAAPNPSRYIDVAARVQHLSDLGVNAVMLNPTNEFPGAFSGGYNPISAWAMDRDLGTMAEYQAMVDALHGAGIAVLLDIVWNHFDGNQNYLWNYDGTQIYFDTPAVGTPWGDQHDFDRAQVRDYFVDSVDHLLGDLRLDGFRMDAVMYMVDGGLTPQWAGGQSIVRSMNDRIAARYADKISIAEKYDDDTWTVGDTSWGLGFDAQYHNRFKNTLRGAVYAENAGGDPDMGAIASVIQGTGGSFGEAAFNYFELHDDAWSLNGHERFVRVADPVQPSNSDKARGLQTVANGLVLTAKGIPAILQGTEWLEDDGWETNKLDWSLKSLNNGVFRFYRDLIALRTGERAMFAGSPLRVLHVNDGGDVLAFERSEPGGNSFVVVANLSPTDYTGYLLGMPRPGAWTVAINNDRAAYDGDGFGSDGAVQTEPVSRDGQPQRTALDIPGYGLLVLAHATGFSGCNDADLTEPADVLDLADITAFVALFTTQNDRGDLNEDGLWDLADVVAFMTAFNAGCP
jgi:1,4-alpha-glucan branching enzyme